MQIAEGEEGAAVLREIFEAMQFFGRTTSGDETFFYGLHTSRQFLCLCLIKINSVYRIEIKKNHDLYVAR
jgi:hypothetical protein